tara:strand:- start:35364 stop:35555 length:192 start_codon:yes stop_codon:yes gene_type:complete
MLKICYRKYGTLNVRVGVILKIAHLYPSIERALTIAVIVPNFKNIFNPLSLGDFDFLINGLMT